MVVQLLAYIANLEFLLLLLLLKKEKQYGVLVTGQILSLVLQSFWCDPVFFNFWLVIHLTLDIVLFNTWVQTRSKSFAYSVLMTREELVSMPGRI